MAGRLTNLPSEIMARVLVLKGWGTTTNLNQTWPVYAEDEPDKPDNVLTVYVQGGDGSGRTMTDGEQQEEYTFQVRIRSQNPANGWSKANQIANGMDKDVLDVTVTLGTIQYLVHCVSRRGSILSLGKEYPSTLRSLFTINAQASIRQLT